LTRKTEYEKVSPILYIKVVRLNTRAAFFMRKRKEYKDMKLTKYEKETIILTSEGEDTYNVYTFNAGLKRRLADFAKKYPAVCRLESEDKNIGCQSYVVDKARLSIRLTAPYSEARLEAARERARISGFQESVENCSV
jgi:predicted nucleotidyltransferase